MAFGVGFSVALLSILGAHEMGHFLTARAVGVPASPPYFIPLPPVGGLPGTLGAVIAMGADRADRSQLALVGAAGPLAGFVVAVPMMALALVQQDALLEMSGDELIFGRSLITGFLEGYFSDPPPPGFDYEASPMFLGAWMGLFMTALNLFPMGQLDGGHLMHALTPRLSRRIGLACLGLALAWGGLGILVQVSGGLADSGVRLGAWEEAAVRLRPFVSPVFFFWGVLASFFGIRHPPIRNERGSLSMSARIAIALCAVVLALTLVPNGIYST